MFVNRSGKTISLLILSFLVFFLAGITNLEARYKKTLGRFVDQKVDGVETPYTIPDSFDLLELTGEGKVKNVILMIGDGMGLAHVNATRFYALGPDGRLHMERMPVTGFMSCHSANRLITDSAASGTAFACGHKTNNGTVGEKPDGTPVKSIAEAAMADGLATGLVVTCKITHATPAVFASHVKKRSSMEEIAEQLSTSNVEVMFGGGKKYFIPKDETGSERSDDKHLLENMKKQGYSFVETRDELMKLSEGKAIGLFNYDALTTEKPEPMLAEMTGKALELLSKNKDGFFLMVEGSQIDWAGHDNAPYYMLRQTLLFDDAVRTALEFAADDGNTLVIVTADHETGGLTIRKGDRDGGGMQFGWSTGSHSAVNVPVYTFGPGDINFTGSFDNTSLPKKIAKLLKLKSF